MRKAKIFFYIFYFGFFAISIIFALYTDAMFKQFGMFGFLQFLKYWIILGMVLMVSEWIIENIHIAQLRKSTKKQESEILQLKAELYGYLNDKKVNEVSQQPTIEYPEKANPATEEETKKNNPNNPAKSDFI